MEESMLEVFVPSRSRFDRSLTLEALHGYCVPTLVVPRLQVEDYRPLAERMNARVVGCPANGIAGTRLWIGTHAVDKFIMLDDDLRFARRANEHDTKLVKFEEGDMFAMLAYVEALLDKYMHVAISARQANNGLKLPGKSPGRPLRALAYRRAPFLRCQHGRTTIMEDFDVTLQLLRMGYPNFISAIFCQDQGQTQLPGGCSDYRTLEVHEANVRKLATLHAPHVELVQKQNKTGGEFGSRLEARISWIGALEEGTARVNAAFEAAIGAPSWL
jgi:hypothetical protein